MAPLVLKGPPLFDWGDRGNTVHAAGRQGPPPRSSSLMKTALPEHVAMLHLALAEPGGDGSGDNEVSRQRSKTLLMTLQHLGSGTGDNDEAPAAIDLGALLNVPVREVEEVGLTYVYSATEVQGRMRWPVEGARSREAEGGEAQGGCLQGGSVVLLAPHDLCALRVLLDDLA